MAVLLTACGTHNHDHDKLHKSDASEPAASVSSDTIYIGGIAPLSGEASVYGDIVKNTAEMRVAEINENGGILGKDVQILWEDGKCNPKDASLAAQKLIGVDGVKVILGGACSGETLGAAPIAEKNEVLLLSSVSTSSEITDAGDFVFRTAPSDAGQGLVLANYATEQGYNKVGIISEASDYAVALKEVFVDKFEGESVVETYVPTESDFKIRITKLKNADLDALFINSQTPTKADIILKQLSEQKWEKPILSNEILEGGKEAMKNNAEILVATDAVASTFVAPASEEFAKYKAKYKELYDVDVQYENYSATTLDAVNVLKAAIEAAESETNTNGMKNYIYGLQDYNGIFGTFSFDENGDVNIAHKLFTFDGEDFVPFSEE